MSSLFSSGPASMMLDAFKQMVDCAFWCNEEGHILWANDAAYRALQYTEEELQQHNATDIVYNLTRREWLSLWKSLRRHGSFQREVYWKTKQGTYLPFEVTFTLMLFDGEEVAFGLARDISPRLRAEAAREQSEKAFQHLVTNIPGAVYRCALDDDWTMSFLSESVETITGYPASDFLGPNAIRTFASLIHPQDADPVGQEVDRCVASHQPFRVSYRIFHADGDIRWFHEWGRAVYDESDEVLFLIGTIFDATESKTTEEALVRARSEAESANRAKSEFLATMSHEIRTPMNAIINMARLALETDLTLQQRQYLDIVETSSRNLLTLLNDILDFSKIEANKIELESVSFSLLELLEELTDTFRDKLLEKSLELILFFDSSLPEFVVGDPLRVRQILINLLSNAFKFTERGEIILRIETDSFTADSVGVRFSVEDTGIGIPADKLQTLFDAFTQADSSTTREFGGTGLGLAISNQLVGLMGGQRLEVQSQPSQGSCFSFTLTFPIDEGSAAQQWQLPEEWSGLRVLLVTPHELQREALGSWMERAGIECTSQRSLGEARKLLHMWMSGPDLPIADVLLVDVGHSDPRDIVQSLREYWFPPLPMILMGTNTEAAEKVLRSPDRELYLQKPITPSSLLLSLQIACFGQVDGQSLNDSFAIRWSGQFEGSSILLVEDNPANQFVAREMLTQAGFSVEVAETGAEAIQKVRSRSYAAVLMDVQMPEMDGLEATQCIRREWPKRTLPIIAMTANAMKGDAQRCLSAGMDDYIAKPVHRENLLKKLHRWIYAPAELNSLTPTPTILPMMPDPDFLLSPPEVYTPPTGNFLPTLEGIALEEGLERLGLTLETFIQLWEGFVQEQQTQLMELEEAVERLDFERVGFLAHSLAGAAANLSAPSLQQAARALERAARHEAVNLSTLLQNVKKHTHIVQRDVELLSLVLLDAPDSF